MEVNETGLIEIPGSPAPVGGTVLTVATRDRVAVRAAYWCPPSPRGTVLIATGRSEFIEKYFETIEQLLRRELAVSIFDWRGQGLSARLLADRRKGHVSTFDAYQRDVDAVIDQVLTPFCPQPWFGLAHSMGASVLLLRRQTQPFRRLVLTAPMVSLVRLLAPRGAGGLARGLTLSGFGGFTVPRGRRAPSVSRPFATNLLTSDPERYARAGALLQADPGLGIGDPTIGWVHAAFQVMARLNKPEALTTIPVLAILAGADRVVDSLAAERLVARLKAGRSLIIPGAMHEILMERDAIQAQFWAAFDAFIPGGAIERAP